MAGMTEGIGLSDDSQPINMSTETYLWDVVSQATQNNLIPPGQGMTCEMFNMLTQGVTLLPVTFIGLIGNSLALATFWERRNKNSTALLLMTLAVFDTIVLLVYSFMLCPPAICIYWKSCSFYMSYIWVFCSVYLWPIGSAMHLASTWQVTLVAGHRYMAVCHPHKYNSLLTVRKTCYQVIVVGIASLLFNIPRFFRGTLSFSAEGDRFVFLATGFGKSKVFFYFYEVGLYYVVIYAIPFSALLYMTVNLIKVLRESKKKKLLMTEAKKDEDDLTFTLVIVVLVFMICQVMNPIRRGISLGKSPVEMSCGSIYKYISYFASLGILLNSASNFIIYCLCAPGFRRSLAHRICGCRKAKVNPAVPDSGLPLNELKPPTQMSHTH